MIAERFEVQKFSNQAAVHMFTRRCFRGRAVVARPRGTATVLILPFVFPSFSTTNQSPHAKGLSPWHYFPAADFADDASEAPAAEAVSLFTPALDASPCTCAFGRIIFTSGANQPFHTTRCLGE